jgi:hypothetical protein
MPSDDRFAAFLLSSQRGAVLPERHVVSRAFVRGHQLADHIAEPPAMLMAGRSLRRWCPVSNKFVAAPLSCRIA